jgi:hypothetical protein
MERELSIRDTNSQEVRGFLDRRVGGSQRNGIAEIEVAFRPGREQHRGVPITPEAGPPPEANGPGIPDPSGQGLGGVAVPGGDPVRRNVVGFQQGWIAEIEQIGLHFRGKHHLDEGEAESRPLQVRKTDAPTPPRLEDFSNCVLRGLRQIEAGG